MLKNKNFLLSVILPIVLSIIVGIFIIVLNSKSILNTKASMQVANEKSTMSEELERLKDEKKGLSSTAAKYDKDLEENKVLVDEVNSLNEDLENYKQEIEKATQTVTQLDTSMADKTAYNNSLSNITSEQPSQTKSYTNVKLNVPTDISAGRYKAEGNGKLMIYTIAGTLHDKQDLSILDTHSYVFTVTAGQSIKIENNLSLTKLSE